MRLSPMKTNRYVPANILQLLLVIAAFIWQARVGSYGNGLIDVEDYVIRNSCKVKSILFNNLFIGFGNRTTCTR